MLNTQKATTYCDLHWSAEGMSLAIVHVVATLTNEGWEDGRIVGAAAASVKVGTR